MRTTASWLLAFLMGMLPAAWALAAELDLEFPQQRRTFQTNERIDVSVVRSGKTDLPAGELTLTLVGEQSTMTFTFDVKAAKAVGGPAVNGAAHATTNLHLNGWLIKPGKYTLTATMGDASQMAVIEIFSHIRKSSYRTIHWEVPRGDQLAGMGEDGLGFNLCGSTEEFAIREKMDVMGWSVMGRDHQHDGNLDCDWSDPNVYIGAMQRGVDAGLGFRTLPNAIGVHLAYQPGLTWNEHPRLRNAEGKPTLSMHDIAAQRAAYFRAFDEEQTWADDVDTKTDEGLADWTRISDFKLGYMDAFWKASRDAIERMKPGHLAVTSSMYGWNSLYDGYYFNVARSMPVIAGHAGYSHNFWLLNMNPSFFLEMTLPRQMDKPTWYRPGWGSFSSEQLRLEMYMSFIAGVQGLAQPAVVRVNSPLAPTAKEINAVASRLGTIFAKPAYTRQAVAMLYSKSNFFYLKIGKNRQIQAMGEVYLATRLNQYPLSVVLEEDVLDGSLAASHKAVVVAGVDYLSPAVVEALTDFVKNGGVVIVSDDVRVSIPGATKLGMEIVGYEDAVINPGLEGVDPQSRWSRFGELDIFSGRVEHAAPLAERLGEVLAKNKIPPAFHADVETIAAGYQVRGEIEYVFAVNFTIGEQPKGLFNGAMHPAATAATILLPDTGRPVYDAVQGGEIKFAKSGQSVSATLDFAGGDMRVLARPARPIGGVLVATPTVSVDLTREGQPPIQMTLAATLVDTKDQVISGTAPLQIVVKDPAGNVRYDLFRATEAGVCRLTLPLAANDAAGRWTVVVTDLLAGTTGQANFEFKPLTRARAVAGATHRAVFFGDDKANIYRFFRDQRNVIIAKGTAEHNTAAAERLAEALKPYNITCTIVHAKDVPARELTAEEARTWCGTGAAGAKSGVQPGRNNSPENVGWDLPHPVILLGTPEDNRMIRHLVNQQRCVLAYRPTPTFPGRDNGMVAWNIQSLGHDVQAIVCIGYNAEGMSQAVGTLFELAVGLDPLFPLAIPKSATIEVGK